MPHRRSISAFDIIGPIMVGPSSSHTAGAVRLGQVGRAVLGVQPKEALIGLHGSFAETGRGHGTDRALVAGLLGMDTHDPRIRDSLDIAREKGMRVAFEKVDLGEDAHPNSARLHLKAWGREVVIEGASVGGGVVEITQIQGFPVRFSGKYDTLIVVAEDRPGTINIVTGLMLDHRVNVAFLRVGRKQRGGDAIMVYETDDHIPEELVEALEDFHWVRWVRHVPPIMG